MKKLAGTTWGADTVTLKGLYTGGVRPVLEVWHDSVEHYSQVQL